MGRSLDGWLGHIGQVAAAPVMLGLDRLARVWDGMGTRLDGIPIVTVAGTNGKGSCVAMIEAVLSHAGYRTLSYTSPHMLAYNERVRIDGSPVPDSLLCESFSAVEEARARCGGAVLTYFEFGTLGAAWCAARAAPDACVLEVGLGARLDAVNLFDPDVSVITSVDIDHVEHLGSDREQIGLEKAHVMRPGRPAVVGDRSPPRSLRDHAKRIGARALFLGEDFGLTVGGDGSWTYDGPSASYRALPHPALRGRHQLRNAATALTALGELRERLPLAVAQVRQGLLGARLPGRMQVLPGRPCVVLDVAHNVSAARSLDDALAGMGFHPATVAIFGIMSDKDIDGVTGALGDRVDEWLTVPLGVGRGCDPVALAGRLESQGRKAGACASVAEARERALAVCGEQDRVVVFGSFLAVGQYLQAEARPAPRTARAAEDREGRASA